jgi:N-methylhydantoinase B
MLSLMSARHMAVPTGLLGGSNGTRTEFLVNGRSGIVNAATKLWPGDVVTIRFPGAGGYGPPQMRDSTAVARDVANGLMSENGADAVYGSAWRTADAAIQS